MKVIVDGVSKDLTLRHWDGCEFTLDFLYHWGALENEFVLDEEHNTISTDAATYDKWHRIFGIAQDNFIRAFELSERLGSDAVVKAVKPVTDKTSAEAYVVALQQALIDLEAKALDSNWKYLGTDADGNEWYAHKKEGWVSVYEPETETLTRVE